MPGPPPKDAGLRQRRNATLAMTTLPAEGRRGRTPKWPLLPDVEMTAELDHVKRLAEKAWDGLDDENLSKSERATKKRNGEKHDLRAAILEARIEQQRELEAVVWRELWKIPQATQWEKLRWTRDVAAYVRHKVRGEIGSMEDAKEARAQADRLGLTPMSLLRLRWEIKAVDKGAARAQSHRDRNSSAAAAAASQPASDDPRAFLHAVK